MFDDHGYPKMSGIVHGQQGSTVVLSKMSPKNTESAKDMLVQ